MNARLPWLGTCAAAVVAATIISPLAASARPPRSERVANRIAERRYARVSIAEARVAQAEARAAEIAALVPVPPPPRPATVRRMARAGVPLGGPTPPAVVVAPAPQPPRSLAAATPARAAAPMTALAPVNPAPAASPVSSPAEPGAWTLEPDAGVTPAAAEVAPDGTRSVLAAGGELAADTAAPATTPKPAPAGPPVSQPAIELLPTPAAK